jgi:uncharacterized protein YpbB
MEHSIRSSLNDLEHDAEHSQDASQLWSELQMEIEHVQELTKRLRQINPVMPDSAKDRHSVKRALLHHTQREASMRQQHEELMNDGSQSSQRIVHAMLTMQAESKRLLLLFVEELGATFEGPAPPVIHDLVTQFTGMLADHIERILLDLK